MTRRVAGAMAAVLLGVAALAGCSRSQSTDKGGAKDGTTTTENTVGPHG